MRRTLLALGAVLLAANAARAEYVVIIANLSSGGDIAGGAQVGGAGMLGGGPPTPGGMLGIPGGMLGGKAGGMFGGGIAPPGGMLGGAPPTPGGKAGGMFPGGPPPGPGFGGGGPGMPGLPDSEAADELATLVIAVIEVRPSVAAASATAVQAEFAKGSPMPFSTYLDHKHLGRTVLQHRLGSFEMELIKETNGRPMPTIQQRYREKADVVFKDKANLKAEEVLRLARLALEYGLLDSFVRAMDELVGIEKDPKKEMPVVTRYKAVKEALAKKMPESAAAKEWKGRLLDGYRVTQKDDSHFALIHEGATDDTPEAKAQLARLENTFRGIYYWWALHKDGGLLPMPKERLVSVLIGKEGGADFSKLRKHLTPGPVVSDSFLARREGVSVFSGRRGDDHYDKLLRATNQYWENGYTRSKIVNDKSQTMHVGVPARTPETQTRVPRVSALLLKALEHEWEMNAATHEVARQLPFAIGLVPPKVHAPEWVQFGMGSLFEAPLQSPWHGIGSANSYYLPRFKEYLKAGSYDRVKSETPKLDLLLGVITDDLFRAKPKKGSDGKDEPADAAARRARAASWALTYYLAKNRLPGLQAYYKELSKLPRDVDLDRSVLEAAFARAFNCVEGGKPSRAELNKLADAWMNSISTERMEAEKVHEQVRKAYATVIKTRANPGMGGGAAGGAGGGGGGIVN